ncbi:hypothetical protein M514_18346 [Trichuris suis]|uniref:Uncharacterized protein n=1 Tax=Trichuris suis TaxID=68888 RepID=A0A085NJ28_9BILA|nr:hypothetical protein M514_18346 [Trichuris suis]
MSLSVLEALLLIGCPCRLLFLDLKVFSLPQMWRVAMNGMDMWTCEVVATGIGVASSCACEP